MKQSGKRLKKKSRYPGRLSLRIWLGRILISGALLTMLTWASLMLAVHLKYFGEVPSVKDLSNIQNHNSSEVYSWDGELLGKYYIYDRTSISIQEIPQGIIDALIATEDIRFYSHRGTDYRSLGRVLLKNLLLGQRSAGGGSTITRQLAKNLYPRTRKGWIGLAGEKLREGIIARKLEKTYQKDEILGLYLNTVHFGENVFGIFAASQRFFNKQPMQLRAEEGAVLIGMLKAGTSYNPRLHPEQSLRRRNTVIGQLQKYGYITGEKADSLAMLPLVFDYAPLTHVHGPAPYFRERLRLELGSWLDGYNEVNGRRYNLYTDGLKIFTSIDAGLQQLAELALVNHVSMLQEEADRHYRQANPQRVGRLIDQLDGRMDADRDSIFQAQKQVHAGLVSIEPHTGYVRAWVGGKDIRRFQFDNVVSRRQTGSAFKPFVYAAALESGIKPCEYITNEPLVLEAYDNWSPSNTDGNYQGYFSMAGALAQSVNTVSVRYLLQTGFEPVINLAEKAGIPGPLNPVPSLALGTAEASLLDLTAAYCVFGNQGHPVTPKWLLRIEDSEGNLLFSAPANVPGERSMSSETARIMTSILQGVASNGTASHAGSRLGARMDIAGKTGTTQNNIDSWFIGFTPGLVTGVWAGLENPAFGRIYPLPFGASRGAVPLWTNYMDQANRLPETRHYASGRFAVLPEQLAAQLDCLPYLEELPRESLLDRIFRREDSRRRDTPGEEEAPRRRSLLRRIIEELF
jgi:penicillin-binding protein 1A